MTMISHMIQESQEYSKHITKTRRMVPRKRKPSCTLRWRRRRRSQKKRTLACVRSSVRRRLEFIIQNQYYKFQTSYGFQNLILRANTGRHDKYLAVNNCPSSKQSTTSPRHGLKRNTRSQLSNQILQFKKFISGATIRKML